MLAAAARPRRRNSSAQGDRKKLVRASSCTSLPALREQQPTRRPATAAAEAAKTTKRRQRKKSKPFASRPSIPEEGAVEADWENELARNILVLYGSVASNHSIRGAEDDFAVDEDAARRIAQRNNKLRTRLCAIWFLGSGTLCAEWSALGEPEVFAVRLGALEEAGRYVEYVEAVSTSLNTYAQQNYSQKPGLFARLWRQLVVAATVFGIKCVDQQRYADSLELLKQAGILAASPEHLTRIEMAELRAFVDDSHAYYYYKRAKSHAALAFATKAMRIHNKLGQFAHVAKCHLHIAAILSRMRRHPEAVKCLGQILHLVNTGKLDVGDSTHGAMPHKLCMIAVCYHNLAVEQLFLNHAAEAAVSAQNARRLARLCLSYSNRWLHNFESTHRCATQQLAATVPQSHRRGEKNPALLH